MSVASLLTPLRSLPARSGIYLMKNHADKVIYVGKAKNLRARIRSYYRGTDGRVSVRYLMKQVRTVETIVTENERQALILEADLIKKFKPRYNVRLKDDRSHFIVRIDVNVPWPKIELVRQVDDDGALYFGPFAFAYEMRAMLEVIRETIPLRTCPDRVMMNRVRPCLEYQMKRCLGPCCLDVDPAHYRALVDQAGQLLAGRNEEVLEQLARSMERASAELRFEDAALLRDRMAILERSVREKPIYAFAAGSKDAFGYHREGNRVEVSLLMVRRGRLFGAKSFGFDEVEVRDDELLGSILTQYYDGAADIPEEILLPFELEDRDAREEYYGERRGSKVLILTVKQGEGVRLLRLAADNARQNFTARFADVGSGNGSSLKAVADELHLEEVPRAMECVDVSHFQGGSTVAAVVFFQDGEPDKARYRHFALSQEGKPDDFASIREVVTRHLSRAAEENTISDLMIIDGGRAQLNQAIAVRRELGLTRPVLVGLAKKRSGGSGGDYFARGRRSVRPERVFVEEASEAVVLREGGKALHLLARIRDEAHRFAVTFHRGLRRKRIFRSALDGIPGLGEKRRRALLREFGSVQAIREVSAEEIAKRVRVPLALATRIVERLNREGS